MKRFTKGFLCAILAIALFTVPSFAHSGRTDEFGGHYDRSTGEYHYHHGYPAHQHENGVCPYDFDDQTNHDNRTGSKTDGISTSNTSKEKIEKNTTAGEATKTKEKADINPILIVGIIIVSCLIILTVLGEIEDRNAKKEKERVRIAQERRRNELLEMYKGKTQTDIAVQCGLSPKYEIDSNGDVVPVNRDVDPDIYTLYVSSYGKVFHKKKGCSSAYSKINWRKDEHELWFKRPCLRCKPVLPPIKWLPEYNRVMDELAKYNISLDDLLAAEQEDKDDA